MCDSHICGSLGFSRKSRVREGEMMADDTDRPADELAGEPAGKKKTSKTKKPRTIWSIEGGAVDTPGGARQVPFGRGNLYGRLGNRSAKRHNPVYEMDNVVKD